MGNLLLSPDLRSLLVQASSRENPTRAESESRFAFRDASLLSEHVRGRSLAISPIYAIISLIVARLLGF
jgi:hypothetical protein